MKRGGESQGCWRAARVPAPGAADVLREATAKLAELGYDGQDSCALLSQYAAHLAARVMPRRQWQLLAQQQYELAVGEDPTAAALYLSGAFSPQQAGEA